jgi:site-specific DNA-methyltransferase (adenine-specific)
MENNKNKILIGNSLNVLKTLPDNSIDCCITSPPYWGLRDYGHEEQLGSEKHFKDFVINLSNVFDEVQRVLKPTGTCFINLGDTYGGSGSGTTKNADTSKYVENSKQVYVLPNGTSKASQFRGTAMNKSLCMIPERFAIEMIDRGWCLRNQIIWHKPNQMPSSAKDRFTVDFEKIFFFVKQPTDYYFEQQIEETQAKVIEPRMKKEIRQTASESSKYKGFQARTMTRNVRTTWSINTECTKEAHFATYPQKLVEQMIKAGCPENGIVLDPFFGSGTTGIYARKSNRNFLGVELNPEYVKIAESRLFKELGMFH